MKKTLATIGVASVLALSACGGETVYITVEPTTTTSAPKKTTTTLATTPPLATRPPSSATVYDPNAYDTFLWESVNEFWWLFTEDQLLQMGLLVCEEFDRGQTLDQVTMSLVEILNDTNTAYLAEGMAGVVAGALTYLCPEHGRWLETI